jgi:hypothetical protein
MPCLNCNGRNWMKFPLSVLNWDLFIGFILCHLGLPNESQHPKDWLNPFTVKTFTSKINIVVLFNLGNLQPNKLQVQINTKHWLISYTILLLPLLLLWHLKFSLQWALWMRHQVPHSQCLLMENPKFCTILDQKLTHMKDIFD